MNANRTCVRTLLCALAAVFCGCLQALETSTELSAVVIEGQADASLLRSAGYLDRLFSVMLADPQVVKGRIGIRTGPDINSLAGEPILPEADESYTFAVQDKNVSIRAHDSRGAIYALHEIMDIVFTLKPGTPWGEVAKLLPQSKAAQPQTAIRGLNLFIQAREGALEPWMQDLRLWEKYLDLLSYARFNFLDLHGIYKVQPPTFGNVLSVFVGENETERQSSEKVNNRRVLARIIELAAVRGIRVGVMNYGSGRRGERKEEEFHKFLAWQAGALLDDCPGLWAFGLRNKAMGESAQREFLDGYASAWDARKMSGPLYTRSWGTDLKTIEGIARQTRAPLLVEVKYNGEHLGLPYQAIQGYGADYSYENYPMPKAPYQVLWQVRASGTHRVFSWGNANFIRNAVRSFGLGHAPGFTIETHAAYGGMDPSEFFRDPKRMLAEEQEYLFERDWMWHMLWGRLSYDPETPDDYFRNLYIIRHGKESGTAAYDLLQTMSEVVPRVYASYAVGLDHRELAPEFEIGLYPKKTRKGESLKPRSVEELITIQPLDRTRHCSAQEFAQAVESNREETRHGPPIAARALDEIALKIEVERERLAASLEHGFDPGPMQVLLAEAQALANLARSTASRLRMLTATALYLRGRDPAWLTIAQEELAMAKDEWKKLAETADAMFLPVDDLLRAGAGFNWASVLPHFDQLKKSLDALQDKQRANPRTVEEFRTRMKNFGLAVASFGARQIRFERRGSNLTISLTFEQEDAAPRRVRLLHKVLDGQKDWSSVGGERTARNFFWQLPHPGPDGMLLQFQALDGQGRSWQWPELENGLPWFWTGWLQHLDK